MNRNEIEAFKLHEGRRHFFRECGIGVGKIALASLLTDALATSAHRPSRPSTERGKIERVFIILSSLSNAFSSEELLRCPTRASSRNRDC